jgi:hypothetical protein
VTTIYAVSAVILVLVVDFVVPGQWVGGRDVELVLTVAMAPVILLGAAVIWYWSGFEFDAHGIHQNLLPPGPLSYPFRTTIRWDDSVRLRVAAPGLLVSCRKRHEGGFLSRIRAALTPAYVLLPAPGVLEDRRSVQTEMRRFAPADHPLLRLYTLAN